MYVRTTDKAGIVEHQWISGRRTHVGPCRRRPPPASSPGGSRRALGGSPPAARARSPCSLLWSPPSSLSATGLARSSHRSAAPSARSRLAACCAASSSRVCRDPLAPLARVDDTSKSRKQNAADSSITEKSSVPRIGVPICGSCKRVERVGRVGPEFLCPRLVCSCAKRGRVELAVLCFFGVGKSAINQSRILRLRGDKRGVKNKTKGREGRKERKERRRSDTAMVSIPENRKLPKREADLFKSILVRMVPLCRCRFCYMAVLRCFDLSTLVACILVRGQRTRESWERRRKSTAERMTIHTTPVRQPHKASVHTPLSLVSASVTLCGR